jgi:receptor protein-tyrosine kinase
MIRLGKAKAPKEKKRKAPSRAASARVADQVVPIAPGQYEFSSDFVVVTAPGSPTAAAIAETTAVLLDRHVERGRRGLAMCAAVSGTGVTFMTMNLAATLAEAGVSTIVIDCNLRRPGLERFVRPAEPAAGVQQFLRAERLHVEEIVHSEVLPNLSLIYSGGQAADAQELLAHDRLATLFGECLRNYACTLVDTSAANRGSDAVMVAATLGYAAIVARRGAAYVADVERLREELTTNGVIVTGAVLNQA